MNIRCTDDDNFTFTRRVTDSCNMDFEYDSNNIFQISYINCCEEYEEQFYTMCPRCGRIILLDDKRLSDYEKNLARSKTKEDPFLFQENNIMSEYVNVCYKSAKVLKKAL